MANQAQFKRYDTSRRPGEDNLAYFKRLAKVADQRLVRLEKLVATDTTGHFKGADKMAYRAAMRDIEHYSPGSKKKRFNTAVDMTAPGANMILQGKINAIIKFLDSPSSSKAGIVAVYEARTKTINEKYGTNFTWQELGKLYESLSAGKIDSQIGSDTLLRAYNYLKQKRKVTDDIEKSKSLMYLSDEEKEIIIEKRLKESGVKSDDIIESVAEKLEGKL